MHKNETLTQNSQQRIHKLWSRTKDNSGTHIRNWHSEFRNGVVIQEHVSLQVQRILCVCVLWHVDSTQTRDHAISSVKKLVQILRGDLLFRYNDVYDRQRKILGAYKGYVRNKSKITQSEIIFMTNIIRNKPSYVAKVWYSPFCDAMKLCHIQCRASKSSSEKYV